MLLSGKALEEYIESIPDYEEGKKWIDHNLCAPPSVLSIEDKVNKPNHYMIKDGLEVIDVRDAILKKMYEGQTAIDFVQVDYWSRAWEYLTRFYAKNGVEDLKKAQYYLNRLVESYEL